MSNIRVFAVVSLILTLVFAMGLAHAEFRLVENFDAMATGSPDGKACTGVMGGIWDTESASTGNVVVEDNSGTRTCRVANLAAGSGRAFGFNQISVPIAVGGEGKVFFRFMVRSDSLVPRAYIGLISDTSDDPINGTNTNNPAGLCVGFGIVSDNAGGYNLVKTDGTTLLKTGFAKGNWYNAWLIVNHSAETFDLYESDASGPAGETTMPNPENLVASAIPFGAANPDPINGMIITSPNATPQASRTFIDEIWWDGDQGLKPTLKAKGPSPSSQAVDVLRDVMLSWTPGPYAAKHNVYFGTTFADVDAASSTNHPQGILVSPGQDANTYDPAGSLAFGQTYFWRVDEVNAPPDSTTTKGSVWGFTVEPVAYPVTTPITATASSLSNDLTGPEKTIDGSGLNADNQHSTDGTHMWLSNKSGPTPTWIQYEFDQPYKLHQMWVWNSNQLVEVDFGLGAKDVAIDTSIDGNTWTSLEGVPEFGQATGMADYTYNTTVDFGGVLARYVRLNIQSNWGGTKSSGLSEVRFFYIPVRAFGPTPAPGAADVTLNGELNWRPGREAARHEVYVSTDPNAFSTVHIANDHRYPLNTLGLEYDRTYYWKVNEVNETETPKTWEGDVWNFSTPPYALVDDFETYDDTCNRIYYTWADGVGTSGAPECGVAAVAGNGSAAAVGNISAPYAEQTIINTGRQSMPLEYDNGMWPYYSETQREWLVPQNWTGGGINTLTLSFWGYPIAFTEPSPGAVTMSGIGTDIWGTADQFRFAYKQLSGNGSIIAKVDSLVDTDPWAKAGVMIRETLEAGSAWASVFSSGANGLRFQARLAANNAATTDSAIATLEQMALHQPVWIKMERTGNDFRGYYSTDGNAWTAMVWNPQTIPMAANVYIGLAVTSHNAAYPTTAQYSGISTTGSVSGGWLTADIGTTQPVPNALDTVYVAIEDSSRKMKVASHPNPGATATGIWEEWQIPLNQFTTAGINLRSVTKMVIGVGDRNAPKAGGKGKLYIDNIRLSRTAAQ